MTTWEMVILCAAAAGSSLAAFLDHRNHKVIKRIDVRINGHLSNLERRVERLERKKGKD